MKALIKSVLAVAALALAASPAQAQKYPEKPVRIVVPFGAGGLADVSMRIVAEQLTKRMGQQFVVENRPGAGGIAAASEVTKAPADGHTLILISNGTAIAEALFEKLPYDSRKDFAPISTVAWFDVLLLANPSSPYKSVQDVMAAARAKPGMIKIGAINPGSTQNLTAELFKATAKIDANVIAYKTSPEVVAAVVRGDIEVGVDIYAGVKGAVDGNQVRAIAVTGTTRNGALPNVPTVKESGLPDYEVLGWNALFAKAGTPAPILQALQKEIAALVGTQEVKDKFRELGLDAGATTPEVIGKRLADDIKKWSDVIAKAGIEKQK
jgi:tripartite-type tricarboxylate transporter receptor subunit TctC